MIAFLVLISVPVFAALKNAFMKGGVHQSDPFSMLLVFHGMGVVLIPLCMFLAPETWTFMSVQLPQDIGQEFWVALVWKTPLQLVALLYMLRALRESLSGATPILLLAPVFTPISGYFLIGSGEIPSLVGWVGIVVIIIGAYLINVKEAQNGFFAPIRALFHDRASRFMLVTAMLWSVTSTLDKIGTVHTTPLTWVFYMYASMIVLMVAVMLLVPNLLRRYGNFAPAEMYENLKSAKVLTILVLAGLLELAMESMQMFALTLVASAAYVIAIKRSAVLLDVVIGALIFKEDRWKTALPGICVMLGGLYIMLFMV